MGFGCRLRTARRTGAAVRVVRYAPWWERVCVRHADQPLEHLDLRRLPEAVAAQRRWAWVARRAVRSGVQPERVFALAQAVVARWWEQALQRADAEAAAEQGLMACGRSAPAPGAAGHSTRHSGGVVAARRSGWMALVRHGRRGGLHGV